MDGGDLWRVAACGNSNVNRIMLRFRPIAPKPSAATSAATSAPTSAGDGSPSNHVSILGKRPKRKYVRIRRNSGYVRRNNNGNNSSCNNNNDNGNGDDVAVVTLQLMPEKEVPEGDTLVGDTWCNNVDLDLDLTVEKIQIVKDPKPNEEEVNFSDQVPAAKVVESWVTVESVTGTCMGESGELLLGCTDAERVRRLESDTCPGFVCDESLRVRWVNDAYKRMVVSEERHREGEDIVVWLKVKDSVSAAWWCYSHAAFTCGVRLQYTWRNEKCTKMVPCDVWRLDCGGFAWRLDVKAALSLGL